MNLGRDELWARARALAATGPQDEGLSPRAVRFARGQGAVLALADLEAAPGWATSSAEGRRRLTRLVGAVGSSSAWRRTVDGQILGAAAKAVGEPMLDALLALPEPLSPAIEGAAATPQELEAKGAAALLAEAKGPLLERLEQLLPAASPAVVDRAAARAAREAAEALMLQLGDEA